MDKVNGARADFTLGSDEREMTCWDCNWVKILQKASCWRRGEKTDNWFSQMTSYQTRAWIYCWEQTCGLLPIKWSGQAGRNPIAGQPKTASGPVLIREMWWRAACWTNCWSVRYDVSCTACLNVTTDGAWMKLKITGPAQYPRAMLWTCRTGFLPDWLICYQIPCGSSWSVGSETDCF